MAAVQKKNNMKKRPFKLRSGNRPSMAKLAGVSPIKQEKKAMISSDLKSNSEKMVNELNNRKKKVELEIVENQKNPERIATTEGQNLQNLENIKKRNVEIEGELIDAEKKFSLINLFLLLRFAPIVFNTNLNLKGSNMMLILSKSSSN